MSEGGEIAYTYDKEDCLVREEHHSRESQNVLTYAYDNNANRIEKRSLMGLSRFTYDSVNRLVKAEYLTGAAEYRHDNTGNHTTKVWKEVCNSQISHVNNYMGDLKLC